MHFTDAEDGVYELKMLIWENNSSGSIDSCPTRGQQLASYNTTTKINYVKGLSIFWSVSFSSV